MITNFNFKTTACNDIYDRDFWQMKQTQLKGVLHGYSRRTNLFFALHIINGTRKMEVVGMKDENYKFVPISKCNKDIIKWCKKHNILKA